MGARAAAVGAGGYLSAKGLCGAADGVAARVAAQGLR
jgi:hypothetical protein